MQTIVIFVCSALLWTGMMLSISSNPAVSVFNSQLLILILALSVASTFVVQAALTELKDSSDDN